jgi:hypothetical protein
VREAVPAVRAVRSRSDGEGVRPGKQTAAGGAAPLCGGEVAGVEAVRGEEGAMANSMVGKRSRIHGQRGENGGGKASGGPEQLL